MASKRQDESRVQQACVRWMRLQFPQIVISSFPNQGVRSRANASRMKAEGLTAGCPDLIIFSQGAEKDEHGNIIDAYGALLIEMKTEKGVLSAAQKEVHEKLRNAGYKVAVCRNFDEFKQVVETYLS